MQLSNSYYFDEFDITISVFEKRKVIAFIFNFNCSKRTGMRVTSCTDWFRKKPKKRADSIKRLNFC